jgi:hypothetical protein
MRVFGRGLATVALAMLVAAVPAAAQREPPIKVSLGAGLTIPGGDFNDGFEMGWGALGGPWARCPTNHRRCHSRSGWTCRWPR